MKSKLHLTAVAICMMVAGTASAAITGYVSNPTTNSIDWGNAVTALGATINTSVNFNSIPGTGAVTPAIGGFYSLSDGVTFSTTSNITLASTMSGNGGYTFAGEGEGVWTSSKLLHAPASSATGSVTFTFANGVFGGGVFLVDVCNQCQAWTISARDSNNNLLGSYQAPATASFNFQLTNLNPQMHKYFMGISSTDDNIASLTISRGGYFFPTDIVGLDDFRFAVAAPPVPEPAEWTMLIAGLLVIGFIARRRRELRFE
jgi:flagellar hook-associated protein FlgK